MHCDAYTRMNTLTAHRIVQPTTHIVIPHINLAISYTLSQALFGSTNGSSLKSEGGSLGGQDALQRQGSAPLST